jgi:hypothetical protein
MTITPEIKKYVSPILMTNGFIERLAEPLDLTYQELYYTFDEEDAFKIVAEEAGTPLKLAKMFRAAADPTNPMPKLERLVIIHAAHFFASTQDRGGSDDDRGPGYLVGCDKGFDSPEYKQAKIDGAAQERAMYEERKRQVAIVNPYRIVGGKRYDKAINKAIGVLDTAISATLALEDLLNENEEYKRNKMMKLCGTEL